MEHGWRMKTMHVGLITMSLAIAVASPGCFRKKIDWTQEAIPPGTLVIEFSRKLKYVMELQVDGQNVPIHFGSRNKVLSVKGLTPGAHHFNIHSISYVFGPEFGRVQLTEENGAYVFVLSRKYRSALPKEREQVSIRAYSKMLREQKRMQEDGASIHAEFD